MSKGGFSAFTVEMTGKDTYVLDDIYNVVKEVSQKIIDTNQGWSLDESFNTTINDGLIIPDKGMCICLKHTKGTKLGILMIATGGGTANPTNYGISYKALYAQSRAINQAHRCGGLSFGMIPPGMGSFDKVNYATEIMPDNGLRFLGRALSSGSIRPKCFIEDDTMNGRTLKYVISVRDDTIIVVGRTLDTDNITVQITGDILINAHEGDSYTYGQFTPMLTAGRNEGDALFLSVKTNTSLTDFYNTSATTGIGAMYTSDGTLISGANVLNNSSFAVCRAMFYRSTAKIRDIRTDRRMFQAISAGLETTQPDSGIIPGNGYKGIINTEILAQIHFGTTAAQGLLPVNTLLDGGNYLHVGSGLCIGWDPSNVGIEI